MRAGCRKSKSGIPDFNPFSILFSRCLIHLIFGIYFASCSNRHSSGEFYKNLKEKYSNSEKFSIDKNIASSGSYRITSGDFIYIAGQDRIITASELQTMNPQTRRIVLEKALLRRMAVGDGINTDIYEDQKAAEYILPRFEKILEDYYYENAANNGEDEKLKSFIPDQTVLNAYLQKKRKSGRPVDGETLKKEMDSLLKKISMRLAEGKKKEAIHSLIKKNPPIQINF